MTDYEVLLSLNNLEIDRHSRVVHLLRCALRTLYVIDPKVPLLEDVNREIAWRLERLHELRKRRKRFNMGALNRSRGIDARGDVSWAWRNFG